MAVPEVGERGPPGQDGDPGSQGRPGKAKKKQLLISLRFFQHTFCGFECT